MPESGDHKGPDLWEPGVGNHRGLVGHPARPVSNSCTIPGRATTRVGRPYERWGPPARTRRAENLTWALCRGRACPVPSRIHARSRHGRPQGSPLRIGSNAAWTSRGPVGDGLVPSRLEFMHDPGLRATTSPLRIGSNAACNLTWACRGRACPVPSRIHARSRDGRPQGSPLRIGSNAAWTSRGPVGDGLVPSRLEFMHDPGTGDRKGRPYETARTRREPHVGL